MPEHSGSAVRYWIDPLDGDEDLDGVLAVEEESFTNPWTKEMYAWELQNRAVCHIFVVRTPEDRVAGFCAFWLVVDEIHINNVAIRPALRGQGIGSHLMQRVFEEARRLGAKRATLEVRRSNEGARRLYERLGFYVAGKRPELLHQPGRGRADPVAGRTLTLCSCRGLAQGSIDR